MPSPQLLLCAESRQSFLLPPAAPVKQAAATKKATKKRVLSPEGRKNIADASRKRWANLKKSASAATKKTVKRQAKTA